LRTCLALAPDGTTLASAGKDGVVVFWDARVHPEEEQPRLIASGQSAQPAFAPDSRVLAVAREGTVSLLDLPTLREAEQLPALGSDVWMVAYSPDGTLLVGGSRSGRIRIWSCADRRLVQELGDPNAPIYLVRFRADGRRLLTSDGKGKMIWLDTHTWQAVHSYTVAMGRARGVSPDGRLGAIGTSTGTVRWLNAETGEVLATSSDAHRHPVAGIAFSADGTQAASVAEDGTLALWNLSSFQPLVPPFKGHMNGAHGVAFSPDGRRLATGGGARDSVKLWDMSTHRELVTLLGQGSLFEYVAFSPDGRWLAARNSKGELHLWRAPSWAEIEEAEKSLKTGQAP
jgi:WD40 repeat protein